jgi:GTP-binding protein
MKFIDTANVIIKSGDGGPGHISFRREKFVPKGGPDGGTGGKGGDIIFKTDRHLNTLLDFKYKRNYAAGNGKPGMKSNKTGKDGLSLEIKVPCGTVIKDFATDDVIADLVDDGMKYVLAEGGIGGRGNSEFTTSTNQAPRYAEPGRPGKEFEITLELKLIADVGLVGLPNVGKSTLISVISAAKPKIADYPFTTLVPNLGIVSIGESQSFTVADIPGLIEGAADGKGLGIQFLRHVERTRLLVFLLDCFSPDPANDLKTLRNELKKYNPQMLKKKSIICISRVDCIDEATKKELSKKRFGKGFGQPFLISSVTGENINELKFEMWKNLETEG